MLLRLNRRRSKRISNLTVFNTKHISSHVFAWLLSYGREPPSFNGVQCQEALFTGHGSERFVRAKHELWRRSRELSSEQVQMFATTLMHQHWQILGSVHGDAVNSGFKLIMYAYCANRISDLLKLIVQNENHETIRSRNDKVRFGYTY